MIDHGSSIRSSSSGDGMMGLIGAYICLTLVWLLRRRTLITNRDQPSSMLFKSRARNLSVSESKNPPGASF
jgi:hypothetical protein